MPRKSKRPDTDDQDQFDLDEEYDETDENSLPDPEFLGLPYDKELDFNEERPSIMEVYDEEYTET